VNVNTPRFEVSKEIDDDANIRWGHTSDNVLLLELAAILAALAAQIRATILYNQIIRQTQMHLYFTQPVKEFRNI